MTPLATYADLNDSAVFVSGGATGIGRDIVTQFAAQGAHVYFVDILADVGAELARELNQTSSGEIRFAEVDVTDTDALCAAIEQAETMGSGLQCLVNNAALDQRHPQEELTPDQFDQIVAINLKHQFFAARTAHALMQKRRRGSIINFGSVAPKMGTPDLDVYGACKFGAHGLTRSLAVTYGQDFVRVNTIVPGCILTPRQLELWISPEDEADIRSRQAIDRRLNGCDVARLVLFLASEVSSACTAQEFVVDGGIT